MVDEAGLNENTRRTEEAAKQAFPGEEWLDAASLKLTHEGNDFELPPGIIGIKVAKSRLTDLKDEERILVKEIRQGKILTDEGATIYLIPKLKVQNGEDIPCPDAYINGILYEFKNVTGTLKKVERRFRESREQSENVYIKIDNPNISEDDVKKEVKLILNDKKYTGGTKGNLIIHLAQTRKISFLKIEELK
jgi:hypothetical protein